MVDNEHLLNQSKLRLRYGEPISMSLYIALLFLFLYWNITREEGFLVGIWLVQSLPLLALLPGMLKKYYRTYSWLCFGLLFYFIFAVERVFSSVHQLSDYIFLGLVVLLFISSMMTSRWMQYVQKTRPVEA